MKILIIGSADPFALEISCARAFREFGCEVAHWDNKRPSRLFGNRSWWVLSRVERAIYDARASWEYLEVVKREKPDVIFQPKAENIHSHATRLALEATGARLVVWYPDHPFKADMTSMNVLRNLKRCERFYIWGKFLVEPLESAGCSRAGYLPFAFDPEMHPGSVRISDEDRRRFGCDICFVGTWDLERQRDLLPLAEFDLAIWGPGWLENLPGDSPLRTRVRGAGVYCEDLVKAYRCSRLVFNHLRLHNGSAHNMRTMEIAGIGGGVQIVRRTPEQSQELFLENEHLFCFEGAEELKSVVRNGLAHQGGLPDIADRARKHVLEKHTIRQRMQSVLSDLSSC